MNSKFIILTFTFLLISANIFSQINKPDKEKYFDLKENILNQEQKKFDLTESVQSKKNPGLAMLMSFVLPGAGHYYVDRMDVGKYFVVAEVTSWLGVLGLNIYGDAVRDDARKFAVENAGIDMQGKDNDFYGNVGNFNNVYDYNDEKLRRGEYDLLYDVQSYYWNWNNFPNRASFERQRKSSERIYNSRVIFGTALVVNRIISGISSLILANAYNSGLTSNLIFEPQVTYDKNYKIDGIKFSVGRNFSF
jgi:hypothetical protein